MMTRHRLAAIVLGVALLSALGITLGQRQAASRFDKYLRPASISAMDYAVLRANVDLIRPGGLFYIGVPTPTISYNPVRDLFDAAVFYDKIGDQPVGVARARIENLAKNVLYVLRQYVPEVRDEDLVMEVKWLKMNPSGSGQQEVFGEYKNGKVVFK
jgi:hypothetical protein